MNRKGSVYKWMTQKEQKYNTTIAILKHVSISDMAEIKALNRHQLTIDITKLNSNPSSNKVNEYVTHYLKGNTLIHAFSGPIISDLFITPGALGATVLPAW